MPPPPMATTHAIAKKNDLSMKNHSFRCPGSGACEHNHLNPHATIWKRHLHRTDTPFSSGKVTVRINLDIVDSRIDGIMHTLRLLVGPIQSMALAPALGTGCALVVAALCVWRLLLFSVVSDGAVLALASPVVVAHLHSHDFRRHMNAGYQSPLDILCSCTHSPPRKFDQQS